MGAMEDKSLGGNGSVSAKYVQNGLPPGRMCLFTTFQANAGNGYPDFLSAAQVVIMQRKPHPFQ